MNAPSDRIESDISGETYREYEWTPPGSLRRHTYRIEAPETLYHRPGGALHLVVDRKGVEHCVPAVGHLGCVLRRRARHGGPTGAATNARRDRTLIDAIFDTLDACPDIVTRMAVDFGAIPESLKVVLYHGEHRCMFSLDPCRDAPRDVADCYVRPALFTLCHAANLPEPS